MNFLGALGWVLFAFSLGLFVGMGISGVANRERRQREEAEQKGSGEDQQDHTV